MRWILLLFMAWGQPVWAEAWVHVYGVSWHERGGYNSANLGLGWEQQISHRWSVSAGVFENSLDRASWYGAARYHAGDLGPAKVMLNLGLATGYQRHTFVPVILPELCWRWICGLVIPSIRDQTTAAAALYLRIPVHDLRY